LPIQVGHWRNTDARLTTLAASGKPFEYRLFPEWQHNPPFRQALSSSLVWLTKTVVQGQRDSR